MPSNKAISKWTQPYYYKIALRNCVLVKQKADLTAYRSRDSDWPPFTRIGEDNPSPAPCNIYKINQNDIGAVCLWAAQIDIAVSKM